MCQITSNPYSDARAVRLTDASFRTGSLKRISYAKPGKIFTANASVMDRTVGVLEAEAHEKVVNGIVDLLCSETFEA